MNIEPEQHHEPPRTGVKWLDVALAVGILFVSVSSLVVAIVHSRTLERMADAERETEEQRLDEAHARTRSTILTVVARG